MEEETKDKILLWTYRVAIILLVIDIAFLFYDVIIYPSYLSYKWACESCEMPEGWGIGGLFYGGDSNNSPKIVMFDKDEKYLKHELCHYNQKMKNRSYGCDYPLGAFLNEVECNIMMYLPYDYDSNVNITWEVEHEKR